MRFAVVIPVYNEAQRLAQTLDSLYQQSDPEFTLFLVDNASTDNTRQVIKDWHISHPAMKIQVIHEAQKGTGAASDTGFREAIAQGCTHIARTDADCLVDKHWIRNLKRAFTTRNLEFIGGVIKPREDESPLNIIDRTLIAFLLKMADITGTLRRRGSEFKYPYIMVAGNNLAITATLYQQAGGFPRTAIEQLSEDRVLSENVRKITPHGARVHDVIVYNSIRRVRSYGYLKTILWYLDLWKNPALADIR